MLGVFDLKTVIRQRDSKIFQYTAYRNSKQNINLGKDKGLVKQENWRDGLTGKPQRIW